MPEFIAGPPCRNPHYVPGGYGEEFAPVGSHHGLWVEASHRGHRLGYWIWREIPRQWTLKDPLIVVTAQGVKFKLPA